MSGVSDLKRTIDRLRRGAIEGDVVAVPGRGFVSAETIPDRRQQPIKLEDGSYMIVVTPEKPKPPPGNEIEMGVRFVERRRKP